MSKGIKSIYHQLPISLYKMANDKQTLITIDEETKSYQNRYNNES